MKHIELMPLSHFQGNRGWDDNQKIVYVRDAFAFYLVDEF